MLDFLLITVFVSIAGIAQLLLKKGMMAVGRLNLSLKSLLALLNALTTPFVVVGLLLATFSFLLWLAILSRIELSTAMPMRSLMYISTLFLATVLLHEPLTLPKIVGTGLISAGVLVLFQGVGS